MYDVRCSQKVKTDTQYLKFKINISVLLTFILCDSAGRCQHFSFPNAFEGQIRTGLCYGVTGLEVQTSKAADPEVRYCVVDRRASFYISALNDE